MSNSHFVFAVDIGNTRTSASLIDTSMASCIEIDNIPTKDALSRINDIFSGFTTSLHSSCDIKICSVVKGLAEDMAELLESSPEAGCIHIVSHRGKLPFTIDYQPEENLGTDRIADALYAAHFYPNKNIIIVDAGTAVTVDLLCKDKIFRGGVIFPGTELQLKSLAENTSRLPKLDEEKVSGFKVPSTTKDAIQAGTLFSVAGGIDKCIEKIKSIYNDTIILSSGGGWKNLETLVNYKTIHIENLTLLGISLFESESHD